MNTITTNTGSLIITGIIIWALNRLVTWCYSSNPRVINNSALHNNSNNTDLLGRSVNTENQTIRKFAPYTSEAKSDSKGDSNYNDLRTNLLNWKQRDQAIVSRRSLTTESNPKDSSKYNDVLAKLSNWVKRDQERLKKGKSCASFNSYPQNTPTAVNKNSKPLQEDPLSYWSNLQSNSTGQSMPKNPNLDTTSGLYQAQQSDNNNPDLEKSEDVKDNKLISSNVSMDTTIIWDKPIFETMELLTNDDVRGFINFIKNPINKELLNIFKVIQFGNVSNTKGFNNPNNPKSEEIEELLNLIDELPQLKTISFKNIYQNLQFPKKMDDLEQLSFGSISHGVNLVLSETMVKLKLLSFVNIGNSCYITLPEKIEKSLKSFFFKTIQDPAIETMFRKLQSQLEE